MAEPDRHPPAAQRARPLHHRRDHHQLRRRGGRLRRPDRQFLQFALARPAAGAVVAARAQPQPGGLSHRAALCGQRAGRGAGGPVAALRVGRRRPLCRRRLGAGRARRAGAGRLRGGVRVRDRVAADRRATTACSSAACWPAANRRCRRWCSRPGTTGCWGRSCEAAGPPVRAGRRGLRPVRRRSHRQCRTAGGLQRRRRVPAATLRHRRAPIEETAHAHRGQPAAPHPAAA